MKEWRLRAFSSFLFGCPFFLIEWWGSIYAHARLDLFVKFRMLNKKYGNGKTWLQVALFSKISIMRQETVGRRYRSRGGGL